MGYEVHITRKTDWFDEEGPAMDGGASMRRGGFAEAGLPDGSIW